MKKSHSKEVEIEKGNVNEEIDWELRPSGMLVQKRDDGVGALGPTIKVKVSHGSAQHEISIPAQSTFGDLKRLLANETGLEPREQRLLFRGKEKEDEECLHMVGVKDMSKVVLFEDPASKERKLEERKGNHGILKACEPVTKVRAEVDKLAEKVDHINLKDPANEERKLEMKKNHGISKACEAVSKVRAEVDKLAEKVSVLEAAVQGGAKVEEKEFIVLTELLMVQLLKLDGIEAEGEAKVQRRTEVHRVQRLVEKLDILKARNSNPFSNNNNAVSVTTKWETVESGMGSLSAPPPMSSSSNSTQDWEPFD